MTTETATAGADTTEPSATTEAATAQAPAAATEQATEGANAQAKPEDAGTKVDGEKPADAPIVYDFTAPEGVELDASAVERFKAVAGDLKLPPDSAQKVVDLYADIRKSETEAFAKQVETWGEETKADKEFGGDKLPESLAAARKVIDQFGTPEFKSLLDSSGMGNHPEVVKLLAKVGKAISEDGFIRGAPKSPAKSFYDNSNMN